MLSKYSAGLDNRTGLNHQRRALLVSRTAAHLLVIHRFDNDDFGCALHRPPAPGQAAS